MINFKNTFLCARYEAFAIMRSPGWIITMLAPFLLVILIFAVALFSSSAPKPNVLAVSVTPDGQTQEVIERINTLFGVEDPTKPISATANPTLETSLWRAVPANKYEIGSTYTLNGSDYPIDARVSIDLVTGDVAFFTTADEYSDAAGALVNAPPGHDARRLFQPIEEVVYQHKLHMHGAEPFSVSHVEPINVDKDKKTRSMVLIFIGIVFASVVGTLGARSANELSTAYLGDERVDDEISLTDVENFLGKLTGIGFAHLLVFVPWIILIVGAFVLLSAAGLFADNALTNTLLSAVFNPMRMLIFVISIICSYLIFSSLLLAFASRLSESASARSLAGPGSFVSLVPFTITMMFAFEPSSSIFRFLTIFPLTAPCALQIGYVAMPPSMILLSLAVMILTTISIVYGSISWLLARSISSSKFH